MHACPKIRRQEYPSQTTSVYRVKSGDPKQRVWFCFDRALVLPEYLLEYVYVPSVHPSRIVGFHLAQEVEELHEVMPCPAPSLPPALSGRRSEGVAKRFGAVTVGYKCCWAGALKQGRERLGGRLGPRKGGGGGACIPAVLLPWQFKAA